MPPLYAERKQHHHSMTALLTMMSASRVHSSQVCMHWKFSERGMGQSMNGAMPKREWGKAGNNAGSQQQGQNPQQEINTTVL